VAKTQPEKMAAFEGLWKSEEGAPFAVFGIPDAEAQKTHISVKIPKMLSFLIHFDPNARVTGLDEFPPDEHPPVLLPFASYHIMTLLGLIFIVLSLFGLAGLLRNRIWRMRCFFKTLILATPLAYMANEFGWMATEVGRQPWAVYRVLRTSDAVSKGVPAGNILFSLILFILIYALIAAAGFSIIIKFIQRGPAGMSGQNSEGEA
jgi:cytochrome d ubiquinol oxidase subunit I